MNSWKRSSAFILACIGLGLPLALLPSLVSAQDLVFGGSAEERLVYERDPGGLFAGSYDSYTPGTIGAELNHRGLWELQLGGDRFILAHDLIVGTDGSLDLVLEQACLSLELGSTGRLDLGRQEVAFGLGRLFQAVDPLAGTDGRSQFDGLSLVLNPWADHGLKAVLVLDGIWEDDAAGSDSGGNASDIASDAWRRLMFGVQYDGLVGAWEPNLAFFYREDSTLRIAAGSRLGLGPAIFRLEGAWDFENPFGYPARDSDIPEDIVWRPRVDTTSSLGFGGMGTAGVDLYLYPGSASIMLGMEYGYQSRGFNAQERRLAADYIEDGGATGTLGEAAGLTAEQWDTRHRLGFQLMAQPTDRLSFSGMLVLSLVYPGGLAGGMAELSIELNRREDIDLFLHLGQGWEGQGQASRLLVSRLTAGFRFYY